MMPIAAALVTLEPEMVAKNAQQITAATASPPGR